VAVFKISSLDERINTVQQALTELETSHARDKARIEARLAKLRAVRARITPEMEALLAQLNDALES
jgi:uncharacterized protein involved in exopolysaccharide biosynthesis